MFSAKHRPQSFLSKNLNYRFARSLLWFFLIVILVGASTIYISLYLSLRDKDSVGIVDALTDSVVVALDQFGVPTITAGSRLDGYRALGYMTARDRMFQMDLLRRRGSGRLAEIFGEFMISVDTEQRVLGFESVAREVVERLPINQREVLEAYAEGVNSAIDGMIVAPFEFLLLGYRPERWRIEDSLLVVLSMFQEQSNSEEGERMLSVMEQALPAEVYKFLTPMTDQYTQAVLGEGKFSADDYPVPIEPLITLLKQTRLLEKQTNIIQPYRMRAASNAWAVAGSKTRDGRAILANDMHTTISVPNLWYRCHLKIGDIEVAGVNLPGTPLIIAGSSRHLAWGMTALVADVLDLIKLEINPENHDEYLTSEGWKPFKVRHEIIQVKGGSQHELDVKTTVWGPVALKPLLNQSVAIRWTALDPISINIGLIDIYEVETLEEGIAIINDTGGPPLNAILADHTGRVGWATMGRIPLRLGFDGTASRSWSDGSVDWVGYISPQQLPRVIDPSEGFVVNANNRSMDQNYPFTVGHAFSNGYRAYRITERLHEMDLINENEMFQLQLDTQVGVYEFYRDVALSVLNANLLSKRPELLEMRNYLEQWDGYANDNSQGLAMLIQFRMALAKDLLEPIFHSCRILDKKFEYDWAHIDIPLQALLREKNLALLLNQDQLRYSDWDTFLLTVLEQTEQKLMNKHSAQSLAELTWSKVNIADYVHPLSQGVPGAASFLNLSRDSLPGCDFCIRVNDESFGATERLIISPGQWQDGILHIPGGQSGHPLSEHYKDQYRYWVNGQSIPFVSESYRRYLSLMPAVRYHNDQ